MSGWAVLAAQKCGTKDVPSLKAYVEQLEAEVADLNAEHYDVTCAKNAEIRRLETERDVWKTKCETREFAYKQADAERKRYSEQIDELFAECDVWKAKAEAKSAKRAAAAERLKDARYHTLADYVRAMLGWGHEPHFEDCRDALIDLLTDDGDCGHTADMSAKSADCVRSEPGMSENLGDSREKLEADLKTHMYEFGGYCLSSREGLTDNVDTFFDDFVYLLDRQAAITANETSHDNPYVGLVRGKQWERTEISDYYCGRCGWKVTDHDSYCPECGGALHKASNKPDSKFDARKTAETPETDAAKGDIRDFDDSRKKLEADARALQSRIWKAGANSDGISLSHIIELLDRQAAITEREHPGLTISDDESLINWHGMNYLPQSRALNAERERDEFSLKLKHEMELNRDNRNALDLERIAELQEQVDRLTAERDGWRMLCGELLDAAHAIQRIADAWGREVR